MSEPSPLNYYRLVSLIFLILAGLYLGMSAVLNKNYVAEMLYKISPTKYSRILKVLYIIFGLSALYLLFANPLYTFLPFLDKTVIPPSLLLISEQANTDTEVQVYSPGAIKVVYWAAQEDKNESIADPFTAYGDYKNVGIAAVKDDYATLKLKFPTKYKVGKFNRELTHHLHFRFVYSNGVLSEVKTLKLDK
jgi:uncharacterized membrane protein YuzA (DUF378 family)